MRAQDAWTARPTLTVWVYDSPRGASAGKLRLHRLHRQGAVTVEDAALVSWAPGAHRPRIGHLWLGPASYTAESSPLVALLARLIGTSDGDGGGAGDHRDGQWPGTGLDEAFLREVGRAIVPDSSAMLVLSSRADLDAVRQVVERGLARGDVHLMHAILSREAVETLARLPERARPTAGR